MMVVNEVRKPFGFLADYAEPEVENVYQFNEEEVREMQRALVELAEENKRLVEMVRMYQEALANMAVKMAKENQRWLSV